MQKTSYCQCNVIGLFVTSNILCDQLTSTGFWLGFMLNVGTFLSRKNERLCSCRHHCSVFEACRYICLPVFLVQHIGVFHDLTRIILYLSRGHGFCDNGWPIHCVMVGLQYHTYVSTNGYPCNLRCVQRILGRTFCN